MRQSQRRLHKIQSKINVAVSLLQRLSIEASELIEEERQADNESEYNLTVPIEEVTSTKLDNVTQYLSSDSSDLEQTRSLSTEQITTTPERRCSRPSSGRISVTKQLGPFEIGAFLKIINKYKGAYGTIGKVISSQKVYTTIEDFFGNRHKREHRNLTAKLDKRDQKIVTEFVKRSQ